MTLKQIEYFLAFAACGNLTVAADKCLTVQPNLSRQIDKLEDELGKKLFMRVDGRLVLTEAGLLFEQQGNKLMDCYNELLASMSALTGTTDITFGYVTSISAVSALMDYVGDSFLGYSIKWVHGTGNLLFDVGALDICFAFDSVSEPTDRYIKLFDIPVRAIVPRSLMPACKVLSASVFEQYAVMLPYGQIIEQCLDYFRRNNLNVDVVGFPSIVFEIGTYLQRLERERRFGFIPVDNNNNLYDANFFLCEVEGLDFTVPLGVRWSQKKETECRKIAEKIAAYTKKYLSSLTE